MDLPTALRGMLDAEAKLSQESALRNPSLISEQMYRLGQYTSAVEKHLGDAEEEYERESARVYSEALRTEKSATAAKNLTEMEMAEKKGQIKRLSRYVSSSWRIHTACMARYNHLSQEMKGSV